MAYTTAEGRQQVLDDLASAIERLGYAVASLGEAYELLDEATADELETQLFRPVQGAFGRAKRTHTEFAERIGTRTRSFAASTPGVPSTGARGFIDHAVQASIDADEEIGELQDSMLPVEVGDAELRAGLSEVRRMLGEVPARGDRFLRTLGR